MTKTIFRPPLFVYEKFIKKQKKGTTFIVFLFFLLTFIFARTYVFLYDMGVVPANFIGKIRGIHIHHFVFGIFINSLVCYSLLTLPPNILAVWKIRLAAIFGAGLGFTFDEFGMWLRLDDSYWVRQSYDAIIILSILFINIVYFGNFWKKIYGKVNRIFISRR